MSKHNVIAFTAGLAIGSLLAWFTAKKYYEKIAQTEIDSVKDAFHIERRKTNRREPKNEDPAKTDISDEVTEEDLNSKSDVMEYAKKLVEKEGYVNYSEPGPMEEKPDTMSKIPYIINPDEFAWDDTRDHITLCYYEPDDILADDNDEIMENADEVVGTEFKRRFGEYEMDTVYVRNEYLECCYEIVRDNRTYHEVTGLDYPEGWEN